MDNFDFYNPTRIIFGRGAESRVGVEAARLGKKVLLHYGSGGIKKTGLYDRVIDSLAESALQITELPGVQPNPRLGLVREGVALCREKGIDMILAVGGGSPIDSAKAIAMGALYAGDVWDFFEGKARPDAALPVGAVLTIPAAGSEASNSCVITREDGLMKRPSASDWIYPRFSILNPEWCYTLAPYQIACGVSDILAHLMERYFTNTQSVELIDRLIESVYKTVVCNVHKVLVKKDDYDAWAQIMWSGTVAHNNLLSTGRQADWGSHTIEHELSALYDIAHGAGLAVVFPAWMHYVYRHDIPRFAQFAARIWNVDTDFYDLESTALEGIRRYRAFLKSIGMPLSLKEAGIGDDDLMRMAEKATSGGTTTLGSFEPLSGEDVYRILCLAKS